MGAEAGEWTVSVKLADGSNVKYDITVKSVANINDINHPGTSPGPITGTGASTGTAAPVVAKMDAGTGPVASSSTSASSSSSTPGTFTTTTETVAAAAPSAPAPASEPAAPAVVTAPAPISHSAFDFAPSVPAASYAPAPSSQMASGAISGERYRVDPSVSLNGGELHSGAVTGGRHYLPEDGVQLQTGSSRIIDFATKLRRVSIADTTVADIQVINPFQVNLIGHKPGFTTLAIWDQGGQYEERPVRIDPNGKQQVLLNTMVAELDRSAIENQGTNLSFALSHAGVSLVGLPGAVATPFSPAVSTTSPSGVVSSVSQSLAPPGTLTGLVLSQGLTYGLALGNSDYQLQGFFQYLENHQLAKILAQPHLLANSGEEAKFLSGGEIPIVIAQALNTSVVFKQFGTSVEFVPTVVGRNDIELLVKPEVSEPDYAHGVQLFGFSVPAFVTRRAETLVQMKDNQTLIIAGLILHEKKTQIEKVPYLGDVPYLGGLFRNTNYSNTETDLVMSVTPQIVQPLPDGASVYNPTSVPDLTTQQIETRRLAQPDATRPRF
ncbi:type II and III secretion system protein family protein [Candidatus Binatus sp.]|uniref:type II and III secretion system protein family protein n=1 Tax=Candidatus Binatus sp. TaxID=2811406 RepID=UPI002B4A956F|nr:pilus assembly protein N-terminal domain-containing protein [Candidatus Binatus sp.]